MRRKLWAIVVCICMLTTIFSVQALAADETPSYVALGDSITTGYGLTNKETEAFPVLIAGETGTTLTNLAEDGETSASLQTKLQTNESVKTAVAGADVITITIGGNDLMNALYAYLADEDPKLGTPDEIADKFSNGSFTGNLSSLIEYIISFPDSENYTTALQNFESNLKAIISQIKLYNSDAKLVVATQYNPYGHIDTSMISIFFDDIDAALAVFETGVTALNKIINTDINYSVADVYTAFKKANTAEDPLCNASFSLSSINLDFHPNAEGHKMIAGVVADAIGTLPTPEPEPENANITIGGVGLYGDATTLAYAKTDNNGAVTTSGASDTDYNIKWDGTTLTLKDAVITTSEIQAISYNNGDLKIVLIGDNRIISTHDLGIGIEFYGERADLTISAQEADAQLEVSGNAYGIYSGSFNSSSVAALTFESGTIRSSKIYVLSGIAINGGTVTANGGISTARKMTINNTAMITAIATGSEAINAGLGITINGGEVIASRADGPAFTTYTDYIEIVPPENMSMTVQYGESAATATSQTYSKSTKIQSIVGTASYFHSYSDSVSEPTITGIAVSPKTATVQQGDSRQFTAAVIGSGDLSNMPVNWSVNGSISASNGTTIDNGLLKVAADEKAESLTVTASASHGNQTFSDTAAVTVTQVQASSVTVEPSEITLMVGQTYQLEANVDPIEAAVNVVWSSNAPSNVTVDENGLVTAIAAGLDNHAIITAAVGSKVSKCTVTIKEPNITIGGVGFYSDGSTIAYGRTTNDGTVIAEGATESDYNIKWDGSTLTLRNATINNKNSDGKNGEGIASGQMTTLVSEGQNTVIAIAGKRGISYDHFNGLTISGNGSLSVIGGDYGIGSSYDKSHLTINSGTVIAKGGKCGIDSHGLIISGGNVTATGHIQGIYTKGSINNVVINPIDGKPIAVTAGADAASAAALAGSPFTSATTITDLLSSDMKYVHIEVKEVPPSITTQPQSATVTEGQQATFSVAATGNGLRYQWQRSTDGTDWADISGANNAVYTTDAITLSMNGTQYRCIVKGVGGSVTSDAAILTVQETTEAVDPPEPSEPSTPPSRPTTPSEPEPPSGPSTVDSEGWDSICEEITNAEEGDSVVIDMGETSEVPAAVFEEVAGMDVDLTFDLGDGVRWSVNGTDIPADANLSDLDLGVEMDTAGIPVDIIDTVNGKSGTVQVTLAHDGDFGFTMTLTAPLGVENAGYWANLYHYDEDADQLTFETAAEIDADGSVSLPMSHASQYAIVIDDHSHATIDLPFSDVSADDWFYAPVVWIYNEGLMTGTSATMFEPNTSTTRAMIVSMLARLEGVTSAESAGFSDVSGSDWYATAVNWAASEGIVGGFGDSTFQPNSPITREQMASILYRYAEYKGYDVSARADLSAYSDQPSVWAEEVLSWAVAEGLLNGVTDDELQPQGQATRAQVAAILQRFLSE